MRLFSIWLFLISFSSQASSAELPNTLRLATTDWCPYACSKDHDQPGIVHEYLEAILSKQQVELLVQSFPWSRAIALAKNSTDFDGLLTASPSEAKGLLLTAVPIATYQICFFVRDDETWRYQSPISLTYLDGLLGYFADYGYGDPIETFLKDPETRQSRLEVTGKTDPLRLVTLLKAGRIKTFVEDINIIKWQLRGNDNEKGASASSQVKTAGCLEPQPFYLALNPNAVGAQEMLEHLSREFSKPENQKLFRQISEKYVGSNLF